MMLLMLRKMRWGLMMLRMKDDDVENDDLEEEEEDDEVEDGDVEEEDRSQDRDPHFVGACAVEMHLKIPQEPLYARIYK